AEGAFALAERLLPTLALAGGELHGVPLRHPDLLSRRYPMPSRQLRTKTFVTDHSGPLAIRRSVGPRRRATGAVSWPSTPNDGTWLKRLFFRTWGIGEWHRG